MTVERTIVVGLDDVKAVTLECRNCRTRVVLSPDHTRIPRQCPDCGSNWLSAVQDGANFLDNLRKIRAETPTVAVADPPKFLILFEFDETELAGRS